VQSALRVTAASRVLARFFNPEVLAGATIALGLVLRLAPIADDALHPDECLYASWALAIRGGDAWLRGLVIDKPPVYPYLLALWSTVVGTGPIALRLLGAVCSVVGMVLTFRIAQRAWGEWPAWAGVVLLVLSPVAVALDATALTDPPAVALGLGAVAAAMSWLPAAAGILLGLAAATKPQLLAYAPIVLLALPGRTRASLTRLGLGLLGVAVAVALWEWVRAPQVGFLAAALTNYGPGSEVAPAEEWAGLLRWLWGAPIAALMWALTLGAGLIAWARQHRRPSAGLAMGAGIGAFAYLSGHLALRAPAWDRYLVALVPLAALGVAWAAGRMSGSLPRAARTPVVFLIGVALAAALWTPAFEASQGRLPLGDTSRWHGMEDMADYVRGQVPGRATILHRDLGWHIAYYLAGYPQDFRWYRYREQLGQECRRAEPAYILLAADEPGMGDLSALKRQGFSLRLRHATYRRDGSPALLLYLVERDADAAR
jgi:4-amino-4-deoxy-L-arabinose transferase-like glycosyltransferase